MTVILTGLIMAISFAAPPGAITAESLRRGMVGGWRSALGVQLGSIIGDAFYGLLGLVGVAVVMQQPVAQIGLGVAGTLLLFYLAWSGLRAALGPGFELASTAATGRGDFITGAALSLANPWGVVFWLGIGGALLGAGLKNPTQGDIVLFYLSYIVGVTLYAFFFAAVVGWGRRFLSPRVMRAVTALCAVALGLFAILFAWQLWPSIRALLV